MKRHACLALALVLALALPAIAGEYGKCKEDTQTCLDHMVAYAKTGGWLGIEMDMKDGPAKTKITRVLPGSPAEASGFKAGDVLVSVNGTKFAENTEEKCVTCEATKETWKPGSKFHYVVNRAGKDVELDATLAALPPDVLAMRIGMHMMEHAKVEVAEKK